MATGKPLHCNVSGFEAHGTVHPQDDAAEIGGGCVALSPISAERSKAPIKIKAACDVVETRAPINIKAACDDRSRAPIKIHVARAHFLIRASTGGAPRHIELAAGAPGVCDAT